MKMFDRLILALCFAGLAAGVLSGCQLPTTATQAPPVLVNGDGDVTITYEHDNSDSSSHDTTHPVAK